jgi:hypothetical protein
MEFKEIFNEDGLYVGTDFIKGYCFEVNCGILYSRQYLTKDSINFKTEITLMNKHLFNKEYKKVFNRQSLFK